MNPEDVSRHDVHAARFHFKKLIAPFILRHARIMKFAHHGKPWLLVEQEASAVNGNFLAPRVFRRPQFEIAGLWRGEVWNRGGKNSRVSAGGIGGKNPSGDTNRGN